MRFAMADEVSFGRRAGFITIPLRNVLRHRGRTAMTLAAIGFGVAGLILSGGFVEDIFVQLGDAIIQSQAGHVQIAKQGFSAEGSRSPEKYLIPDPKSERTTLSTLPE